MRLSGIYHQAGGLTGWLVCYLASGQNLHKSEIGILLVMKPTMCLWGIEVFQGFTSMTKSIQDNTRMGDNQLKSNGW